MGTSDQFGDVFKLKYEAKASDKPQELLASVFWILNRRSQTYRKRIGFYDINHLVFVFPRDCSQAASPIMANEDLTTGIAAISEELCISV